MKKRTKIFFILALSVMVLAPFLAVPIPAFGDAMNHLARIYILAHIGQSLALQRFYAVHWQPIPYLAMDVILLPLARVMPIYLAGKLFICACVLMPPAATMALHYTIYRRLSLVPAAAFLLSANYLLALGFLSFLFMSGLAVMLFAAWIATAAWARWARLAVFTPCLTILYLGHAYAALAYCLCITGHEIAHATRGGWRVWRGALLDLLTAALPALPSLLLAASLDVNQGYVGALQTSYGDVGAKLLALLSPLLLLIDPVFIASIVGALGLAWLLRRHIHLATTIWPAAAAVGLAAAWMPHVLASTWGMDYRLPLVVCMLLIGGAASPGAASPGAASPGAASPGAALPPRRCPAPHAGAPEPWRHLLFSFFSAVRIAGSRCAGSAARSRRRARCWQACQPARAC